MRASKVHVCVRVRYMYACVKGTCMRASKVHVCVRQRYMYACVCSPISHARSYLNRNVLRLTLHARMSSDLNAYTHTHTHTHTQVIWAHLHAQQRASCCLHLSLLTAEFQHFPARIRKRRFRRSSLFRQISAANTLRACC
jgi:hypothetical protein